MFLICIFALLVRGVFSTTPCEDGVEIVTKETKNPADIIGNWTYVYHWDPKIKFVKEFLDNADHTFECLELHIEATTLDYLKNETAECAKFKIPFNWDHAKLRDVPVLKMDGGIITLGETENLMMEDCITIGRIVIKKMSDDYIVMSYPDKDNNSDLLAREAPTLKELKCISHNLDVGKSMSGFGYCYKKN